MLSELQEHNEYFKIIALNDSSTAKLLVLQDYFKQLKNK